MILLIMKQAVPVVGQHACPSEVNGAGVRHGGIREGQAGRED